MNTIINERKEREENERRNEEIQMEERRRREENERRNEEIKMAERMRKEEQEIAERRRQDEIQIAEQKRKEEIELRKLEYEERKRKEEYEERKKNEEMEFELQKIRLGAEGRSLNSNSVANQNVNSTQIKPKLEIHHLMQKFNSDENDISLYLIMFERLAKQGEILENTWVTHLLGLLPYDVAQLIVREPDEIANDYGEVKKILLKREGNETGHKIINCVAKETNHASEESLSVRIVGDNSDGSNSYLKKAKVNNCDNVQALIDTGSSCCLLKISVAQKLKLKFERALNKIYGFGNQKMPALTSIGRIKADIEVDNVKAENISIYVVPDDAQSVDLIIGRTWLYLPHIAYTKIGKRVHIGYREDELFRNFPIDEKVNPVCLKHLKTAQSESESLQIKDTSQQKMMGNLVNDLKMVKNELRLLQGDIKNFKEERQSLLLQIQGKSKNVDNLKSINDSLVKTNSYYDKNKSCKVLLRKGDIVADRRKPNTTSESTKTQPRYRGPMVVTEIRPSDTYRISQLEPSNGRPYATIVHVSQLKAWRSWNEDDDDSSTNSHNEPEMQRSKRTVRKPLRYGDFMPDR
ncbi:hypothetical protein AVEN_270678-1 [Araneus ventricosus]|uniref:Peptidase A2 domain-containing protein n=1 Tax=Araneus ventricosus TaxID=182803 RepID=A0A4Y2G0D3_ARAVE|nr:hypothetical protein AVEN_270678-1 [Araneus ventricosus]